MSFRSKDNVICGYCGASVRRDKLSNHTKSKHGGHPEKEKGWGDIKSFMLMGGPGSAKKPRLDLDVTDDGAGPSVDCSSRPTIDQVNPPLSLVVSDSPDVEDSDLESNEAVEAPVDDDITVAEEKVFVQAGDRKEDKIPEQHAHFPDNLQEEDSSNSDADDTETERSKPDICYTAKPLIDRTLEFPTDPMLFTERALTPDLIKELLAMGPCQPGLQHNIAYPKNKKGRAFRKDWYTPQLKNGMKSYRDWLVYSPRNDRAYCFPCWLFANRKSKEYSPAFVEDGFDNWKKATKTFPLHEENNIHAEAVNTFMQTKQRLKLGKSVNAEQIRARERQVQHNRHILCRLLDASLFLAKQNLPFRGHCETFGSTRRNDVQHSCGGKAVNEGNFIELIKLLSKYDAVLAHHLAKAPANASYISPTIQNDFIESLAQNVLDRIIKEVKAAHYFGIILDSTIDTSISHVDQLSFCIRYVDKELKIQERFILFTNVKKSDSEYLFNTVKRILEDLGLDIQRIRSQSYDGAANMSGHKSGLQTRVKEVNPDAMYIHCCAHNLNLVLADCCKNCVEAVTFFGTVQKLYTFFSSSQPRIECLEEAKIKLEMNPKKAEKIKLKKQSETRWYCRYTAVKAVQQLYPALLEALEQIVTNDKSNETRGEAQGLLDNISQLEFLLFLEIWSEILCDINSLSEYLQNDSMDLVSASTMVNVASNVLKEQRTSEHFESLLAKARHTANVEDVTQEFKSTRPRKRKRMPGEKSQDEAVSDPEERFRTCIYYVIYDILIAELEARFKDFMSIVTDFRCLMPQHLGDMDTFHKLVTTYNKDVDVDLATSNYKQFCKFYKGNIGLIYDDPPCTLQEMLFLLNQWDIPNAYPTLSILYRIMGTIAISSASCERSFSRLKLTKTYLRSTMGQQRLSCLALLSIEREFSETLNFNSVLDTLSQMSVRRFQLK